MAALLTDSDHSRHTLGTRITGAPETIRTPELCRRRFTQAKTAQNKARQKYRTPIYSDCPLLAAVRCIDRLLHNDIERGHESEGRREEIEG